jgi:hypothetical protein
LVAAVLMALRAKVLADFVPMHLRGRRVTVNLAAAAEDRTVRHLAIGRSVVMASVGSEAIATAVVPGRVPMNPRSGRVLTQINPFKRI